MLIGLLCALNQCAVRLRRYVIETF